MSQRLTQLDVLLRDVRPVEAAVARLVLQLWPLDTQV